MFKYPLQLENFLKEKLPHVNDAYHQKYLNHYRRIRIFRFLAEFWFVAIAEGVFVTLFHHEPHFVISVLFCPLLIIGILGPRSILAIVIGFCLGLAHIHANWQAFCFYPPYIVLFPVMIVKFCQFLPSLSKQNFNH